MDLHLVQAMATASPDLSASACSLVSILFSLIKPSPPLIWADTKSVLPRKSEVAIVAANNVLIFIIVLVFKCLLTLYRRAKELSQFTFRGSPTFAEGLPYFDAKESKPVWP
jgi:hypothetical protein